MTLGISEQCKPQAKKQTSNYNNNNKQTKAQRKTEFRSCVKFEVDVLGSRP